MVENLGGTGRKAGEKERDYGGLQPEESWIWHRRILPSTTALNKYNRFTWWCSRRFWFAVRLHLSIQRLPQA
jgi:hypothetical protein